MTQRTAGRTGGAWDRGAERVQEADGLASREGVARKRVAGKTEGCARPRERARPQSRHAQDDSSVVPPRTRSMRGVDLDHDGVPDYLVASPDDAFRVFSGRTGEVVMRVPDDIGSGHFAVAVPPQPGSSFGLAAFTDRDYYGSATRRIGRLRVVRASHPAVRRLGAGCSGTLGHEPQLGMIDRGNDGVRLHFTGGGDAGGALLLGLSSTAWGGLPLPLRLDGLGFLGCSLYGSVEASAPVVLSPPGPNGGYG